MAALMGPATGFCPAAAAGALGHVRAAAGAPAGPDGFRRLFPALGQRAARDDLCAPASAPGAVYAAGARARQPGTAPKLPAGGQRRHPRARARPPQVRVRLSRLTRAAHAADLDPRLYRAAASARVPNARAQGADRDRLEAGDAPLEPGRRSAECLAHRRRTDYADALDDL